MIRRQCMFKVLLFFFHLLTAHELFVCHFSLGSREAIQKAFKSIGLSAGCTSFFTWNYGQCGHNLLFCSSVIASLLCYGCTPLSEKLVRENHHYKKCSEQQSVICVGYHLNLARDFISTHKVNYEATKTVGKRCFSSPKSQIYQVSIFVPFLARKLKGLFLYLKSLLLCSGRERET